MMEEYKWHFDSLLKIAKQYNVDEFLFLEYVVGRTTKPGVTLFAVINSMYSAIVASGPLFLAPPKMEEI